MSVLQNLNPLIELDGYYLLVHWLDRPNLRSRSLAWLRDEGGAAFLRPSRLRGHGFEAGYALASILYLIGSAALIVSRWTRIVRGRRTIAGLRPLHAQASLRGQICHVVQRSIPSKVDATAMTTHRMLRPVRLTSEA